MKRAESVVDSRLDQVLKALRRNGVITVEEICEQTGVSVATARRDLQTLEERGLLRRNHGGAQLVEPMIYEAFRHDSTFDQQMKTHSDEKRRIAAAAAELVKDGETIALTPGTTTTSRASTGLASRSCSLRATPKAISPRESALMATRSSLRSRSGWRDRRRPCSRAGSLAQAPSP